MLVIRSYGVMVITEDSDSSNPGSNPGKIFLYNKNILKFIFLIFSSINFYLNQVVNII